MLGIGGSATTDGGAGLLAGARRLADGDRGGRRPGRPRPAARRRRARGRLRRDEPAPRADRRGRDLRPAEGRDRRRTSRTSTPARGLRRRARSRRPAARPRHARRRRRRRRRVRAARDRRTRSRSFALRPGVDLVMEATDFDARLAGADLVITGEGRIDAQTAFGKTALGVARRAAAAGVPCIAVGGGVEPEGIEALAAVGADRRPGHRAAADGRGGDGGRRRPRSNAAASGSPGSSTLGLPRGRRSTSDPAGQPPDEAAPAPAQAQVLRPGPDLGEDASSATGPASSATSSTSWPGCYGRPTWQRRLDPTSELILTILTQNSADTNAEVAFEALRAALPGRPARSRPTTRAPAGAATACPTASRRTGRPSSPRHSPSWSTRSGRAASPTRRRRGIQATLRRIREERGDYSLEFLGDMTALEARDWLVSIDGIGKKTASVLLLFSFGLPLMPVDRHVERVAQRVGLIGPKATRRRRPRPVPGHARAGPDVRGARQPHPARPQDLPRPAPGARRLPAACRAAASSTRRRPDNPTLRRSAADSHGLVRAGTGVHRSAHPSDCSTPPDRQYEGAMDARRACHGTFRRDRKAIRPRHPGRNGMSTAVSSIRNDDPAARSAPAARPWSSSRSSSLSSC